MQKRLLPELGLVFLFIITSLLALPISSTIISQTGSTTSSTPTRGAGYLIYFIISLLLLSAAIVFLARKKKVNFLRYLFAIAIAFAIFYVCSILYYDVIVFIENFVNIPVTELEYEFLVFLTPVVFLYVLLFRQNWVIIDIAGVLSSAGLAAIWSTDIGLYYAIILMIIFAVYDYIAVYKTKHMLEIASASAKSGAPLFFVMPDSIHFNPSTIDLDSPSDERGSILLGFGDIAIPNIMVVSSYVYFGKFFPFFVMPLLGGVVAMVALFLFVKRPAPGLPFLNAGVLLGLLSALLISAL